MGHVQNALVVGIGVDGDHIADLDAELALQHQGHRGQAVGGARGVGHDIVLGRVVLVLIHAHDDGDVLFLGRGGDDDLFGPVVQVHAGLRRGAKNARAFNHNVHVMRAPGQLLGVALGKAVDVPVAHGHFPAVDLGVQITPAVDRVVFRQMEVGFRVEEIVDGHHFHAVLVALVQGAENLAADAAEAVDAHFDFFHMYVLNIKRKNSSLPDYATGPDFCLPARKASFECRERFKTYVTGARSEA